MGYTYVKNSRQKLKLNLLRAHGSQCSICGYNKCTSALEFHHLNSEEKEFSLGKNTNIATEKALKETKKCILVCANCHREIHADLIDTTNLQSSYNSIKAQQILDELAQIKSKTIIYCIDCGAIISEAKAERCVACANIARRVCVRPEREELKNLIRTTSFVELGRRYGVSDKAIAKWCVAANLPSKKTEIKCYSDEEWNLV